MKVLPVAMGKDEDHIRMEDGVVATPATVVEAKVTNGTQSINKGDLSNASAFVIMVIGVALVAADGNSTGSKFLLSFGLFSFAGGITNWLAVKVRTPPPPPNPLVAEGSKINPAVRLSLPSHERCFLIVSPSCTVLG